MDAFQSVEAAEQLLRPEFEDGNISQHDFELATRYIASTQQRTQWALTVSVALGIGTALYGRFARTPRWSVARTCLLSPLAFVGGSFIISFRLHMQDKKFFRQLDNGNSILLALGKVRGGMGQSGRGEIQALEESNVSTNDWQMAATEQQISGLTSSQTPSGGKAEGISSGRWEEIRRAASRQTTSTSSWDTLRQGHERTRINSASKLASVEESLEALVAEQARSGMQETGRRKDQA